MSIASDKNFQNFHFLQIFVIFLGKVSKYKISGVGDSQFQGGTGIFQNFKGGHGLEKEGSPLSPYRKHPGKGEWSMLVML